MTHLAGTLTQLRGLLPETTEVHPMDEGRWRVKEMLMNHGEQWRSYQEVYGLIWFYTSRTAQDAGGSFRRGKL